MIIGIDDSKTIEAVTKELPNTICLFKRLI